MNYAFERTTTSYTVSDAESEKYVAVAGGVYGNMDSVETYPAVVVALGDGEQRIEIVLGTLTALALSRAITNSMVAAEQEKEVA